MAWGLTKEDIPEVVIDVLPDVWESFVVFDSMGTQWRTGPGGVIGLDYNVVPLVMESLDIERKEIKVILPDLQVMERVAMKVMSDEQKEIRK